MSSKLTPNERRAQILNVLCARRKEIIENLAFEFDVSRRTIINDITELSRTYPITTVRGNGGCVKIEDWYHPGRKLLTSNQRKALLSAIETAEDNDVRDGLKSILSEFSM